MTFRVAFAVLVLVLIADSALAQKAVTRTVIEGTENGEPLMLTRELNVLESPRNKSSNPKALDFPLEVGKRWHYVSDWLFKPKGSKGSVAVDVVVLGYEMSHNPYLGPSTIELVELDLRP